ncbi:MAG: hypothetical protein ABIH85_03335 [Candidatus Omnitrophota bacterium]
MENISTILKVIHTIAVVVFAIDIVGLIFFAPFKRKRIFVSVTLFISSAIFGSIAWLIGLLVTLCFWGIIPVIIGLLFLGIGIIPIGLLACAINGCWGNFFVMIFLTVLAFIVKMIGVRLLGTVVKEKENSFSKVDDNTVVDI